MTRPGREPPSSWHDNIVSSLCHHSHYAAHRGVSQGTPALTTALTALGRKVSCSGLQGILHYTCVTKLIVVEMTRKERARDVDRPEHRTATGRPAERRTWPRRVTVPTGNAIREQPTTNNEARGRAENGTAYTP